MPEKTRLSLHDISPVMEFGSSTPLSTNWIPLHELIAYWMDIEMVLALPVPVAPLLTAVGHALFALGRETRALRLHTQAWQYEQECAPAPLIQSRLQQAVRHLQEAALHWSRAAFALDTFFITDSQQYKASQQERSSLRATESRSPQIKPRLYHRTLHQKTDR